MLGHRLRRWPNIKPPLGQRLVFAGQAKATKSVMWYFSDRKLYFAAATHNLKYIKYRRSDKTRKALIFCKFREEEKFANSRISRKLLL